MIGEPEPNHHPRITAHRPPTPANLKPNREHHVADSDKEFKNPWRSFNAEAVENWTAIKYLAWDWKNVPTPEDIAQRLPVVKPNWNTPVESGKFKATWLSHASFLVELPAPPNASRGVRVLFDPVYSEHCVTGAARIASRGRAQRHTKVPCPADNLPQLDLVLISHNHFDHLDVDTLAQLPGPNDDRRPHYMVALNNEQFLVNANPNDISVLDWWQSRIYTVDLPSKSDPAKHVQAVFEVTCLPSQHQSNRSLLDRNHSLWCGFAITSVTEQTRATVIPDNSTLHSLVQHQAQPPFSCFFAGDTGYAWSPDDEVGEEVCPAFKRIGEYFGGFDLALLPIGAYDPRSFTSGIHASPEDSVAIYRDVKARRALAIHWGTFTLTNEPLMQPQERLKAACKEAGLADDAFTTSGLGATVLVPCDTGPKLTQSSPA